MTDPGTTTAFEAAGAPTKPASWPKLQCVGATGSAEPGSTRASPSASSRLASTRTAALSTVRVRLRSARPFTDAINSDRDR